jgi:hypothetical protein
MLQGMLRIATGRVNLASFSRIDPVTSDRPTDLSPRRPSCEGMVRIAQ